MKARRDVIIAENPSTGKFYLVVNEMEEESNVATEVYRREITKEEAFRRAK
jgi:hypothetical protein